ncbi:MAG: hypothetical protein JXN61_10230 [Sedimentisphaerales bacterium]|nr:hypothetical protein [Sedimentisphaerales bacterium]
MITTASRLWKTLSPVRLTGPLLDKELRVSSRRKRNYVLRFVYVALLTAFVVMAWRSMVVGQASTTFQKSRMALAGRTVVSTIVGFQFVAAQLLAVIMLSTSISDEIYDRTLGLLMTTPISSLQIVFGKLSSKLLQLMLLLAISMPLLAVMRVFGGVPWAYVFSSLCITLTAVIFAGTLSLFYSIGNRRAYVVIIKTILAIGFFFLLLPTMIGVLRVGPASFAGGAGPPLPSLMLFWNVFFHVSPFYAMTLNTAMLVSPALPPGIAGFYWPVHCVIMLGLSVILMAVSASIVRKVALHQATAHVEPGAARPGRRLRLSRLLPGSMQTRETDGVIRRVKGWPVLWKDIRAPFIRGAEGRNSIIGLVITVLVILATYCTWAREGYLDKDFVHVSYILLFVAIAMIFHIVLSANSITSEKESQAWPILLATSMNDWQILAGKAAAVLRRCLVVWLLAVGHIILFVFLRYIHPAAILHFIMIMVWIAVFLTSVGLYFSARFRRTIWAMVATFGLALLL